MADNSEIMSLLLNRSGSQAPKQQAPASQGPSSAPPQQMSGDQGQKASYYLPGARASAGLTNSGQPAQSPIKSIGNFEAMGGGASGTIQRAAAGTPFQTGLSAPTWTPPPMTPSPMDDLAPKPASRVPPQWKRFDTAQQMINGYQNDWNPNPMLIRLLQGSNR